MLAFGHVKLHAPTIDQGGCLPEFLQACCSILRMEYKRQQLAINVIRSALLVDWQAFRSSEIISVAIVSYGIRRSKIAFVGEEAWSSGQETGAMCESQMAADSNTPSDRKPSGFITLDKCDILSLNAVDFFGPGFKSLTEASWKFQMASLRERSTKFIAV